MTPTQICEHLGGRRAGPARFLAKCPAHPDRSPSLAIGIGADGRTLLNCFAGCSLEAVLKAAGLKTRDLFAGPPPTTEQLAELERRRDLELTDRQREGRAEQRVIDRLRTLGTAVNLLGGGLMDSLDDEALAWTFELACAELHKEEIAANAKGIVWNTSQRSAEPVQPKGKYNPMDEVRRAVWGEL